MTEAEIKSSSSLFKKVFKLILFVSSILFLSVTASWLVTKRLTTGPTVVEKGQYEKYVWKDQTEETPCKDWEYRIRQFDSEAIIYYTNGNKYEGEILVENLTINAVSRYVGLEGVRLPSGWGEMRYGAGRGRYRGQWVRGVREGCGEMISPGRILTRYLGQWLQDKQTGWGVIHYSNGATYTGNWVNNLYHGRGRLSWSNGDSYTGNFSYGSMHGRGVFLYEDGSRYDGTWNNGKLTDVGTMKTVAGKCFEVVWEGYTPRIYVNTNCN